MQQRFHVHPREENIVRLPAISSLLCRDEDAGSKPGNDSLDDIEEVPDYETRGVITLIMLMVIAISSICLVFGM